MTTIWIANKNPPFKKDGFDKPLFFNSYWKRKGTLTDDEIVIKATQIFDSQFFSGATLAGEISQSIDFQTFKIRLNQNDEVFRSSFFKVKFEKESFNRYCWVINTRYIGQNTIEFTLETDLWITFMPQIKFDNKRSIESKRRMPNRYFEKEGKLYLDFGGMFKGETKDCFYLDPFSNDNKLLENLNNVKNTGIRKSDAEAEPTNIDFFGFNKSFDGNNITRALFYYALIVNGVKAGAEQTGYDSSGDGKNMPMSYFLVPLSCDNYTGKLPGGSTWANNTYQKVASQSNALIVGVLISSIPPYKNANADAGFEMLTSTVNININDNEAVLAFGKAGTAAKVVPNNPFQFIDITLSPLDTPSDKQLLDGIDKTNLKLFDNYTENMEAMSYTNQFYDWRIKTMDNQSIPYSAEYLYNDSTNTVDRTFKMKHNIMNNLLISNFYPSILPNNPDFYFSSFMDSSIASGGSAWTNFLQNSKASYNTSLLQNNVNAGFGIAKAGLGTLSSLAKGDIGGILGGAQAAFNSMNGIRQMEAQKEDLQRQGFQLQNGSNKGLITTMDAVLGDQTGALVNGTSLMYGALASFKLRPDLRIEMLKHYRLFGNPIKDRIKLTYEALQKREFWNYWELEDIQNTFVFDNIPPFVIDELDKTFTNGIRLWTIWWDAENNYIDTIYNYDLENYETSLQLELSTPTEVK